MTLYTVKINTCYETTNLTNQLTIYLNITINSLKTSTNKSYQITITIWYINCLHNTNTPDSPRAYRIHNMHLCPRGEHIRLAIQILELFFVLKGSVVELTVAQVHDRTVKNSTQ